MCIRDRCKTSELFIMENANHVFGAKEPWTEDFMPKDLEIAAGKIIEFLNKNLV